MKSHCTSPLISKKTTYMLVIALHTWPAVFGLGDCSSSTAKTDVCSLGRSCRPSSRHRWWSLTRHIDHPSPVERDPPKLQHGATFSLTVQQSVRSHQEQSQLYAEILRDHSHWNYNKSRGICFKILLSHVKNKSCWDICTYKPLVCVLRLVCFFPSVAISMLQ